MSAYVNVEERNAIFAELKGELYRKFRKENISVEWCLKTEKLLTYAIQHSKTENDIEALKGIIYTSITEEEKQRVSAELAEVSQEPEQVKNNTLKEKFGKVANFMKKPLCQEGGYGDAVLLGSVTLYTTVMGIVTLLSEMIK